MNLQALLPFDISITKHKGNLQSLAANKKVSKAESREQVMYELLHGGPATCKELAQKLGKAMHQISGRIKEEIERRKWAIQNAAFVDEMEPDQLIKMAERIYEYVWGKQ